MTIAEMAVISAEALEESPDLNVRFRLGIRGARPGCKANIQLAHRFCSAVCPCNAAKRASGGGPAGAERTGTIGGRYDYKRLQKQHFLQQPRNVLSRSHQSQVNQTKRDNDLETYDSQPLGNPLIASRFL